MLDYIFILLAVLCFTGQFAFTKLYGHSVKQTTATALVMVVVAALVGALLFLAAGGFRLSVSPVSLLWAIAMACIMVPYYVLGIKVLSLGSLAVYSMFMMLGGMLVPFLYGVVFLKEGISVGKLLGTLLLSAFIVLQALAQDSQGAKPDSGSKKARRLFFVLCLVIFVINGMTSVITKSHQLSAGAVDEASYTVLYCLLTALLGSLFLAVSAFRDKPSAWSQMRTTLQAKPMWVMVLIGGAAYTGNFLLLKAASNVPASVQFPLVSGGVIVLSALASALLFREHISKKEWLSVAGAFASTVLFAF